MILVLVFRKYQMSTTEAATVETESTGETGEH